MSAVLVVDDSATQRVHLRCLLAPHSVLEAASLSVANTLLGQTWLVVLDVHMGDGNSLGWLHELPRDLPVIVITGLETSEKQILPVRFAALRRPRTAFFCKLDLATVEGTSKFRRVVAAWELAN